MKVKRVHVSTHRNGRFLERVSHVWAIDTRSESFHGLVGYGYWKWERPDHLSGYRTATFDTRALARRDLVRIRQAFPMAQVIRVTITIKRCTPQDDE